MIKNNKISIRNLKHTPSDYDLLSKWLTNAELLKYYNGRDKPFPLDKILKEYSLYSLRHRGIIPCIVDFENTTIGYIQFYQLQDSHKEKYQIDDIEDAYGLDLFIGETIYWNKGIGTRIVRTINQYLFQNEGAKKVITVLQSWNERAIRCFEKAGLKKIKLFPKYERHEGELRDCWLMEALYKSHSDYGFM